MGRLVEWLKNAIKEHVVPIMDIHTIYFMLFCDKKSTNKNTISVYSIISDSTVKQKYMSTTTY